MPENAEFMTARPHPISGAISAWFLINSDSSRVRRKLQLVKTGEKLDADVYAEYMDTIPLGSAVIHLFDLGEEEIVEEAAPAVSAVPAE